MRVLRNEQVFVYGTLRADASNAWRLEDSDLLGAATVPRRMVKIDWYPGVVLMGKN